MPVAGTVDLLVAEKGAPQRYARLMTPVPCTPSTVNAPVHLNYDAIIIFLDRPSKRVWQMARPECGMSRLELKF
jgi:hypothetical protein